jgi:hypothetical protein
MVSRLANGGRVPERQQALLATRIEPAPRLVRDALVVRGKANIARLLATSGTPGAGLDYLESHHGLYDAVHKPYPYSVRADLEEQVENERLESVRLQDIGASQFAMILDAVDGSLASPQFGEPQGTFRAPDGTTAVAEGDSLRVGANFTFLFPSAIPGIRIAQDSSNEGIAMRTAGAIRILWLAPKENPSIGDFQQDPPPPVSSFS